MLRSLSLRARLVIGVIVLSAVGLVIAGTVTYTSVRSFLLDRTDQTLQESSRGVERVLLGGDCRAEPGRPIGLETADATVLGDRERLRQIVDNLLANVRVHTPATTPVHVRLASSNGHAVLEVEDSGPGLSPEETERIFERFYRADESRSRASGGVGLGLAIVAAVAEAHGGEVAARSDPERGAAFTIWLPLASAGAMAR